MKNVINQQNAINQRVVRCRKLACLTQKETAELLGMKYSTYSQMERQGKIRAEMVPKLANIFDVSTEYLICGRSDPLSDIGIVSENSSKSVMRQPDIIPKIEPLVPTNKETNFIKIYRSLSKEGQMQFTKMVEEIYKDRKNTKS